MPGVRAEVTVEKQLPVPSVPSPLWFCCPGVLPLQFAGARTGTNPILWLPPAEANWNFPENWVFFFYYYFLPREKTREMNTANTRIMEMARFMECRIPVQSSERIDSVLLPVPSRMSAFWTQVPGLSSLLPGWHLSPSTCLCLSLSCPWS